MPIPCTSATLVLLAGLAVASAGCIVQGDSRPMGAAALDALTRVAGISPGAAGCGDYCHGACCSEPVWEDYGADDFQGADAGPAPYAADYDPLPPQYEGDAFAAGGPSCCGPTAPETDFTPLPASTAITVPAVWMHLYSVAMLPRDAVASAVHFCIPPAAMAPPELPPPGRFLPVPPRPAFAPRLEPFSPVYPGY